MKLSKYIWAGAAICGAFLLMLIHADGAGVKSKPNPHSKLSIHRDPDSGKVIISWKGRGVLKKATGWTNDFKAVYRGSGEYVVEPTEAVGLFALDDGSGSTGASNVYSQNVVGYVSIKLPSGLSLIANPLSQPH